MSLTCSLLPKWGRKLFEISLKKWRLHKLHAFMEKSLGTKMCITIRVITGDYCSKSDSKEEDRRSTIRSFALRVDETIRKAIDWQQGMTRRNKPQLPWFCNSCDKHHYHRSSFSFVWKSRCFSPCFCIACYLCSFASQQTIKVAYVTSLGGLRPKAALFEIFGWTVNMYVCVYTAILRKVVG